MEVEGGGREKVEKVGGGGQWMFKILFVKHRTS